MSEGLAALVCVVLPFAAFFLCAVWDSLVPDTTHAREILTADRVVQDLAEFERPGGVVKVPRGWKPQDYNDFLANERMLRQAFGLDPHPHKGT